VGTRSTRIQTLQGQELVVTNKQLTNAKINNYGKMPKRRIVFHIGVTYETDRQKLNNIPDMIRKIIRETENCTLDRVHFYQFGDFSLDFEIVYYVDTGDYNAYMDVQQNINYAIVEAFDQEKIDFAYPTQVIYSGKLGNS
jgi:small-conductance mechanosensitive channel